MHNIFTPNTQDTSKEIFDTLLQTNNIQIEKITSHGQTSDEWYEQDRDEWVVLIEGEGRLLFDNENEVTLAKGEHIYIPSMKRHKVIYTSTPAVWLAIYFKTEQ